MIWKTIFAEITLSHTAIEINAFLHFMQKFKMSAKNGEKTIFGNSHQYTLEIPWGQNFVKIALSHTVSEVNACLCFTQKFKMAGEGPKVKSENI